MPACNKLKLVFSTENLNEPGLKNCNNLASWPTPENLLALVTEPKGTGMPNFTLNQNIIFKWKQQEESICFRLKFFNL